MTSRGLPVRGSGPFCLPPLRWAGLVAMTAGVCKPVVLASWQIGRDGGWMRVGPCRGGRCIEA
jgi:hypothetical protein